MNIKSRISSDNIKVGNHVLINAITADRIWMDKCNGLQQILKIMYSIATVFRCL